MFSGGDVYKRQVPAVALTIHGRRTANGSHWNLSETGMIHIPI